MDNQRYNPIAHIDEIIQLIENGGTIPFSTKVTVDQDVIIGELKFLRDSLPKEIEEANKIVAEGTHLIDVARKNAANMADKADIAYKNKVNEHSITKGAQEEAIRIQNEAQAFYDETCRNADRYVKEKLEKVNNSIAKCAAEISMNLKEVEARLKDDM